MGFNSKGNPKVFIIGLDGATFDIINPLVKEGKLPTFQKIMSSGAYGQLGSTIPPVTAPAWTSLLTGKNPGKHGLFTFTTFKKGSYDRELVSSYDIRSKTIADILGNYGKIVGLLNVPMTYPPKPVNGFTVAGLLAPGEDCSLTYPPDLYSKLLLNIGDYRIDYNIGGYPNHISLSKELHYITELRKKAGFFLMEEYPWDFFFTVFVGTDRIQHWLWDLIDPTTHPDKTRKEQYGGIIPEFYRILDRTISEIMGKLDEDTVLILASDHGFGPCFKKFHANNWLAQLGLLTFKEECPSMHGRSFPALLRRFYRKPNDRIDLEKHEKASEHKMIGGAFFDWWKDERNAIGQSIDWSKTKAFCGQETEQGVFINLKGRFPNGVVEQNEYESLRDYIIDQFYQVTDSKTGQRIIEKVYRREELYSGDAVANAPDIIVETSGYLYEMIDTPCDDRGYLSGWPLGVKGSHRKEGIFLIYGPHIRQGTCHTKINIIDIAPTILYLMGLPIPEDMDGRVITELFEESYSKNHAIHYHGDSKIEGIPKRGEVYTQEDTLKIKERLKGLGYIDT